MSFSKYVTFAAALLLSTAASAGVVHYDVSAYDNTTGGGLGSSAIEGPLLVSEGEALQFYTDPDQVWHGAFWWDSNYGVLSTNASGTLSGWEFGLGDIVTKVGTLVGEIDGDFRNIGAGNVTMNAWGTGELHLWYADINKGDNSGMMQTSVTTSDVPEPAGLALFGLGLAGLAARRRQNAR